MNAIGTLLIANRGEIACRIVATAKRLGINTAAIYTAADAQSLHRRVADECYLIDNYLNIDAVIGAAKIAAADALHPGCGFLSESAAFAEQCRQAGVLFVGPTPAAMQQAASKAAARRLAAQAGIATVPGFDDVSADNAALAAAADDIGYPVLIKAVAGGGGRGMRVVENAAAFADALALARREAKGGFGDDSIILEKYLHHARHIEVQLLADAKGGIVILGERDCSLQRRHQKVLEEAPAPALPDDCRRQLHDTAKRLAAAMQYENAGTVEFLFDSDSGQLYFLEINARLQVEHPVTEMIYGIDLVEWQLRLAAGETLPARGWQQQGVAMEARLCAENPLNNFLPAVGRIQCSFPPTSAALRIDSGVESGDAVSEQYDSMLAKLIVHAETRAAARAALVAALDESALGGVDNNIAFVRCLAQTEEFADVQMWTTMIETQRAQWTEALYRQQDCLLALAATLTLLPPSIVAAGGAVAAGDAIAPMNAIVSSVNVQVGDAVEKGMPLLTLEAMKMEVHVHAAVTGVVKTVCCQAGGRVAAGELLVEINGDASA